MIIYKATFKKKDGTKRKMNFARLDELPKGKKPTRIVNLQKGQELVWDIDKDEFRVFNWQSVIGKVSAQKL